jgi:methyltransferase
MKHKTFILLLSSCAVARVAELFASRRHERRLSALHLPRRRDRAFPLMVAAHLLPFLLAPVECARGRLPPPRAATAAALGALGAATAVRLWVLRTLGAQWNVRIHGGAEMEVVERGPYRLVRHPNYAAVIVELFALPAAGGAWLTALAASALDAVALALRIRDEEAALAESPAWRARMAHKPRFLPHL